MLYGFSRFSKIAKRTGWVRVPNLERQIVKNVAPKYNAEILLRVRLLAWFPMSKGETYYPGAVILCHWHYGKIQFWLYKFGAQTKTQKEKINFSLNPILRNPIKLYCTVMTERSFRRYFD